MNNYIENFNAEEARSRVNSLIDQELKIVLIKIRNAADEGLSRIELKHCLKKETQIELKVRGFIFAEMSSMEIQYNQISHIIKW